MEKGKKVIKYAVAVLSGALTVLLVVPGYQGENFIQMAIEGLKSLLV